MSGPIHGIALDVDGVLTDGTFWWGPGGAEFKRFHFLDVMGVARALRAGIAFALISGEDSPLIERYAAKLRIDDIFIGCKDKASALRTFAARRSLDLTSICFMGDDVNDIGAMAVAGIAAAPANAHSEVLARAAIVTKCAGGNGAVRELIDQLALAGRITLSYDTTIPTK